MPYRTPALLTVVALTAFVGAIGTASAGTSVEEELRRLVSATDEEEGHGTAGSMDLVRTFYKTSGGGAVWWTRSGWSTRARIAVDWLRTSDGDGLRPRDYPSVRRLLPEPDAAPAQLAKAELELSASLLRYVFDVQIGRRPPATIDPDMRVTPRQVDAVADLAAGIAAPDFSAWLATLPPAAPAYRTLRQALAHYRALAGRAVWPLLADGPMLGPGARDPRVPTLRRQLSRLGDLVAPPTADDGFDDDLAASVRAFQARHGLDVDGVVGPATRRALNRTPAERAAQIELNMERLRWLADDPGRRHVVVNIADFRLTVVAGGRDVFSTPVVVGRDYRRTPVFSDRMINLVLSPAWTVPPRIARLDLLPKLRSEPAFLRQKGFSVYSSWAQDAVEVDPLSIDWAAIRPDDLRFKFRQAPGPFNALGGIRFSLTNDFNIYLHDTPDRNLFSRSKRAFSSGCIRVEDVIGLALFALDGDPSWPAARLRAAMDSGRTQVVRLATPLPVRITYMTAWVDAAGRLQFREDVYRRDERLAQELGRRS